MSNKLSQESINKVSLEQALIDVEVANARVIDLTERLTTMSKELYDLRLLVGALEVVNKSRAVKFLRLLAKAKRQVFGR